MSIIIPESNSFNMMKKIVIASLAVIGLGLLSFTSFTETSYETSKIETEETFYSDSSFAEIYPTTFQSQIFVKGQSDVDSEIRIEVFDMSGLLVRTFVIDGQLTSDGYPLNMGDLNDEGYIVRVYESNELLIKERIFKK